MSVGTLACIPCWNEAGHIGHVVQKALRFVDTVVVVDDGSTDRTRDIARNSGAMVVCHPVNLGYGSSLQTGFNVARKLRAAALVILDGDGQHLPEDIPPLLDPILNDQTDLCIGSRLMQPRANEGMPPWRELGIRVITTLSNSLTGIPQPLTDAQSGFRAFAPRAFERLNLRTRGMGASVEIIRQLSGHGLRIMEAPIRCLYLTEQSAVSAIRQGIQVFWSTVEPAVNALPRLRSSPGIDPRPANIRSTLEEVSPGQEIGPLRPKKDQRPSSYPSEADSFLGLPLQTLDDWWYREDGEDK